MDTIFCLEIIGTVVFAIQGSMVAIEERLDILGIMILGMSTAVGGGMIRDIILGATPPAMFINPIYCIVGATTVAIMILIYRYIHKFIAVKNYHHIITIINFLDAVGLGVFTVVGVNISIQNGYGDNAFLCCFVGTMTGVGGGILRDILANRTPFVLQRDIYAVASIIGAIIYISLNDKIPHMVAVYAAVGIIVGIRMITLHRNVHLPSIGKTKIDV